MRHQTGKKVLLLADLDAQAGWGKYSILDAIGIVHDLDRASWEQVVTKAADNLHVLPSPCLMGAGELQAANIRQLLTRVRSMYDWVLDLGRLNGTSAGVLNIVNQVFVVTTIRYSRSLFYEARRVIDALVKADVVGYRLLHRREPD